MCTDNNDDNEDDLTTYTIVCTKNQLGWLNPLKRRGVKLL